MIALRALDEKQNSPFRGMSGVFLSLVVAVGFCLMTLPVQASHKSSVEHEAAKTSKGEVTVAAKDPETTGSVQTDASPIDGCSRSRKRLFVEGEGWIVRRVTTCY